MAGDVRANENVALTAIHTLFAREHNRIVASLGRSGLSARSKFELARRVVGAEIEYITYNEFLPDARRSGSTPTAATTRTSNPSLENEFATVGYRAHSMIHGEFEPTVPAGTYTERPARPGLPDRGNHRRAERRRNGNARDPARGRVRQSRPARAGRRRADPAEPRRAPVQERRADRQLAAQRPLPGAEARQPESRDLRRTGHQRRAASRASRISAPTTSSAAAITGCPTYNAAAPGVRTRTGAFVHGHHGRGNRPLPERTRRSIERTRSTIRTSSTSSGCRTTTGNTVQPRSEEADEDAVVGDPAHDARCAAEGDLRERRQGRRVRRAWSPSSTWPGLSSDCSSSRSGSGSSRHFGTATASTTRTIRSCAARARPRADRRGTHTERAGVASGPSASARQGCQSRFTTASWSAAAAPSPLPGSALSTISRAPRPRVRKLIVQRRNTSSRFWNPIR